MVGNVNLVNYNHREKIAYIDLKREKIVLMWREGKNVS